MEKLKSESIENFWSHFPGGLTFRELSRISPEQTAYYQQNRAAQVVVEAEVSMQLVPELPVEVRQSSAA